MISPLRTDFLSRLTPRALVALVAVLGLGFVAAVLVPGFELSNELANTTAALKFVADQQRYPDLIRTSLDIIRDRLSAHGYVEAPLDQLRGAVKKLDDAQAAMEQAKHADWFDSASETAAFSQPAVAARAASLRALWRPERESLEPLVQFSGVPYQDDEVTGTVLNDSGRGLVRDVNAA